MDFLKVVSYLLLLFTVVAFIAPYKVMIGRCDSLRTGGLRDTHHSGLLSHVVGLSACEVFSRGLGLFPGRRHALCAQDRCHLTEYSLDE